MKLIGLDMDGTLLSSEKTVLPHTHDVLSKLSEKHYISLSTGRAVAELSDYDLSFVRYGNLVSGGLVYDFKEDKIIDVTHLDGELIDTIINYAKDKDIMIQLMCDKESVVSSSYVNNMAKYGMGVYQPMFLRVASIVDDIVDFALTHKDIIIKINLHHTSGAERDQTREVFKDLPLCIAYSEDTSIEFTPLGVNKGKGLVTLREYLNVKKEDTIIFGDADNDLEVLQEAGTAVAMGNANDRIKAIADVVTLDNDHDGIAYYLENNLDE